MHKESLSALEAIREKAPVGQKIVFVFGNFNVIHPGHLRILKFARECGDFLVVGVQDKSYEGAILDEQQRLEGVKAVSLVDYAFVMHDKPADIISALKPSIVVKGKEHENTSDAERDAAEAYGGRLLFCSGDVVFSSVELLKNEFAARPPVAIVKPADFPKRHGFGPAELKAVLAKYRGMRVLVIGDLIVDDYIECDPLGMSQEDPTLVVAPVLNQKFVGGAGIVAAHAAGLGCKTTYVSVATNDDTYRFARAKLEEYGVDTEFLHDGSRPTTLKQRYRARGKTLLRVSQLKQHSIEQDIQAEMLERVAPLIKNSDLVILADFNYGCLPQPVVDAICLMCAEAKVPFAADSQSSSQIGDVCRFKNALLLKPTEREARLALRDFQSGLISVIDRLQKVTGAANIAVTLGPEGVLARTKRKTASGWAEDRLPAFNSAPKDTAGAGDCFLVATALALATGADIWQGIYMGSLAAACQVGRIGNVPLTAETMLAELEA